MTFYKKYSGKIFFAKYFGWAKHLFGPCTPSFFDSEGVRQ